MRPPNGRDVELEGRMLPVGGAWARALVYCAFSFTALWGAMFVVVVNARFYILVTGCFAAYGFAYLYRATRATLDARAFGAMRLRAAAAPAVTGGRFHGSLRVSDTAAVPGTLRAELRCVLIRFDEGRREETAWAEERSFPIRTQVGGSYALLEFDIPPGMPPSEAPAVMAGAQHSQNYARWEIQAIAESGGAFRDELYTIQVNAGQGAAAAESSPASLPYEVVRAVAPPQERQVPPAQPPRVRVPKPVALVQDLAEPVLAPPRESDPAAIVLLVAANLVPLAGVAFWGWQVQQVVFLYWMENLVIGGYNVLRILAFEGNPQGATPAGNPWAGKLALAGFFTLHYGFFCYGHGIFLAGFFGRDRGSLLDGPWEMVQRMLHEPVVVVALVALLLSHGWSFFRNYIGRGEYQRGDARGLMMAPYQRIVVTHVFIIFGGFLTLSFKNALLPMLLFVALKTGSDLYFHLRGHRGQSTP